MTLTEVYAGKDYDYWYTIYRSTYGKWTGRYYWEIKKEDKLYDWGYSFTLRRAKKSARSAILDTLWKSLPKNVRDTVR